MLHGEVSGDGFGAASDAPAPAAAPAARFAIRVDAARDAKLAPAGRAVLRDRFLLPGEGPQALFARLAASYADDAAHAQRLYDHMSKLWFLPEAAVFDAGRGHGLPLGCHLNSAADDLEGITALWRETAFLAAHGGSVASHWGRVGRAGRVIPFIDATKGMLRAVGDRARPCAAACYLDISHPEIEAFLAMGAPDADSGDGDAMQRGVLVTDAFMEAVRDGTTFGLVAPDSGETCAEVAARALFQKLVESRLRGGGPHIAFLDHMNRAVPSWQRELGLAIGTSGLSAAMALPTETGHQGRQRSAAMGLALLNLGAFDAWRREPRFIEDVLRFLDNVLSDYLARAPAELAHASHAVGRSRAVGLGVTGLHGFLQGKGVAFGSARAKSWNGDIFRHIRGQADEASMLLAAERGACPDAEAGGVMERFSCKLALAPAGAAGGIFGGVAPGIEPLAANAFVLETSSGHLVVRNPHLEKLLIRKAKNSDSVWDSILAHDGSVQHLAFLDGKEKQLFLTAFEIDQRWLLELAADRTPFVDQAQALDLFVAGDVGKWELLMLHYRAWELGIKSLAGLRRRTPRQFAATPPGHPIVAEETSAAP